MTCKAEGACAPERLAPITQLGVCAGCQRFTAVENLACACCRRRFGEKGGLILTVIRTNRDIARRIFNLLPPGKRSAFIQLFGDPRPQLRLITSEGAEP